jgi:XTP/dITP diphosphohydrolase
LLAGTGVELVAVSRLVEDWEVEETGETLEENATLKADAAVEATGITAIADDTGLFVDALGGLPGVRSSRYAGPGCTYADNVRKLLEAMRDVAQAARGARFRTAVVLACPDGSRRTFEGALTGSIAERARGTGGFGYDPVFVVRGGVTLAELPLTEKNRVSHRGAAFAAFAQWVAARGERGICPCGPGVRY